MGIIPRRTFSLIAFAAGFSAVAIMAQSSGTQPLLVQVNPEAHLDTPTASLSFTVNNPGQFVTSQPVTIAAWVRALSDQQIHLIAQPEALKGPTGIMPTTGIRWSGTMSPATGGATAATCTSGDFSTAGPRQIIAGWIRSGIAKCTLTFGLATDAAWAPGVYTATIDLSVFAQ